MFVCIGSVFPGCYEEEQSLSEPQRTDTHLTALEAAQHSRSLSLDCGKGTDSLVLVFAHGTKREDEGALGSF
jgi:hypothetical protein